MAIEQQQTSEVNILRELEPVVEMNLNRHLAVAQDWNPHDYVPYDVGRNFVRLGGIDWEPEQSALSPVAKTAMVLNLLTEDNLPSYHRTIMSAFKRDGAWRTWADRWTAEEGRHAIVMRDYLVVTRGVDPVALEAARMEHMSAGYDNKSAQTPLETLAYVSFQELATRISHRNTGKACGDPIAEDMLARVSKDENLHMIFYRNLVAAAFEIDPNATMEAVASQVMNFEMPGAEVPGFGRMSREIANAEIYSPTQHLKDVLEPVLKFWKVDARADLSGRGEQAREALSGYLGGLAVTSSRFTARLERQKEARIRRGEADQ